ncbi:hypothetical protein [Flavobacterium algicola]|uniref:hypothetical protein n=1 Tax=Flavobacterium algicola TaxID=556529 RepID=UPI001EFCEEC7|nr:hypothetical protein [Flavobacterium algicola]MCG9792463.1 hypothetical protein [Flavobacterium algicola]
MKKMYSFYCCLFLFTVSNIIAQEKQLDSILISPSVQYEADLYNKKGEKQTFNGKMMNILFAKKVGTAFGGSNDLTLQKFYSSLDVNDKSISIGANFEWKRSDETKKLTWLLSAGAKIKAENKFATVYDNGDFQENNIGTTFKITRIGRGSINFTTTNPRKRRDSAVLKNRELLYEKYDKTTQKFNVENLNEFKRKHDELSRYDKDAKDYKTELEAKSKALYIEMAKEEITYLENNKMYHFVSDNWWSLEVFVPIGENKYLTTSDVLNNALSKKHFYAFNATLSWNYMREYSCGYSFFFKAKANLKNNNNILVDDLKSKAFQTSESGAGGTVVIKDSNDGYITDFEQFVTPSLIIEPAFFIFNNSLGFSPAIELNQGKYNKTNWKLGIPISLKDKDGKPKVNFEVQWKEINTFNSSSHLVGISVNFLFGELIN